MYRGPISIMLHLLDEMFRRTSWGSCRDSRRPDDRESIVSIVVVNYNTLYDISRLLFSAYRFMGTERVNAIVVVDNCSDDGSRELLAGLHGKGLLHLISNDHQKYHGPGLNQGINYLAKLNRKGLLRTRYVLLLYSDVILMRRDMPDDLIRVMKTSGAAVAGEMDYHRSMPPMPHVSSLMIDPCRTWKWPVIPFAHHGQPSRYFFRAVSGLGMRMADFGFNRDNYLLHLGEGTLRSVYLKKDSGNQYYGWAQQYHRNHFSNVPDGQIILEAANMIFDQEVKVLDAANLETALSKAENLSGSLFDKINRMHGRADGQKAHEVSEAAVNMNSGLKNKKS